jgi:hypothetical protein
MRRKQALNAISACHGFNVGEPLAAASGKENSLMNISRKTFLRNKNNQSYRKKVAPTYF